MTIGINLSNVDNIKPDMILQMVILTIANITMTNNDTSNIENVILAISNNTMNDLSNVYRNNFHITGIVLY